MELSQLLALVDEAPKFILDYEDKQITLAVQIEDKKTATEAEKRILDKWIGENSTWLLTNQEKYNRCLTIQSLGTAKIEKIKEIYEELYRE